MSVPGNFSQGSLAFVAAGQLQILKIIFAIPPYIEMNKYMGGWE
ncbi:hypothetical protein [Bacillus tequilensis]|nr:hypothetical protein [Bacillus tequilensis]